MANSLNIDLTGKKVLVHKNFMNEENKDEAKRIFNCEGGFGCSSFTMGEKIFGFWEDSKESDSISGRYVEKVLS